MGISAQEKAAGSLERLEWLHDSRLLMILTYTVAVLVIVIAVAMRTDLPPGEIADHEGGNRGQSIGQNAQK